MLGEPKKTNRGFDLIKFEDAYGNECSLQQSSAVGDSDDAIDNPGSSFIWLGIDDSKPSVMKSQARAMGLELPPGEVSGWMPYQIPKEVLIHTRMHLNRQQVEELVCQLNQWLQTGKFTEAAATLSDTSKGESNGAL